MNGGSPTTSGNALCLTDIFLLKLLFIFWLSLSPAYFKVLGVKLLTVGTLHSPQYQLLFYALNKRCKIVTTFCTITNCICGRV